MSKTRSSMLNLNFLVKPQLQDSCIVVNLETLKVQLSYMLLNLSFLQV